ncbi:BA75_04473T0 [Komagataella pastoris]|uniref:BA75_04473T0 n=1 Tax=Komagataella pastoris TaxID=4922 RepID=A0A1B2JJC1_PICPA|nr:BA75_04473T0 [Komagataella pastoris]
MDPRRKSTHEELIAASEAVHNEMNSVAALKRLSIGNSLTYDPDLPYTERNEFPVEKSCYEDNTEDFNASMSSSELGVIKYGETVIDTNELLWVPAQYHPNISPEKFRKHIQSSVDQMTEKLNQISEIKAGVENPQSTNLNTFMDSRGVSKDSNLNTNKGLNRSPSSRRRSRSISSLSENQDQPTIVQLTQELQKLSEIAGLNSTDAASLARSLSSSSLGFTSIEKNAYGFTDADESRDAEPSFAMQGGSQLKRSRWTTYRKNGSSMRKGRFSTTQSSKDNNPPQAEINDKNPLEGTSSIEVSSSNQHVSSAKQEELELPPERERLPNLSTGRTKSSELQQPQQSNASLAHLLQRQTHSDPNIKTQELAHTDSKPEPKDSPALLGKTTSLKPTLADKKNKKSSWTSFKDKLTLSNEPLYDDNDKRADPSSIHAKHTRNRHGSVVTAPLARQFDSSVEEFAYEPDNKENELQEKGTISKFFGLKSKSKSQSGHSFKTGKGKHKKNEHPNSSVAGSDSDASVDLEDKITEKFSKVILHKKDRKNQHRLSSTDQDSREGSFHKTSPSGKVQPSSQQFVERSQEENERILSQQASENIKATIKANDQVTRPNGPMQYTDSAFGFPLPPPSKSTLVMLDYRFPIHIERAIYRLSHLKLADPRRPLRQQVLLSNFMYAYLNLVNHTLYLQQVDEGNTALTGKIEL